MIEYAIRRILVAVPTLVGITIVVFLAVALSPGDPAALRVSDLDSPDAQQNIQQFRERFDLDKPIPVRYAKWLGRLMVLDLGKSLADDRPVIDKIRGALWPTLSVNLTAIFIAFIVSVPIGIHAAARRGRWFDRFSGYILYALYSVPSYVAAIALIYWFGVRYEIFEFRGMYSDDYRELSAFGQFWDVVNHMALYVICTAYGSFAYYSRFVRQNMLEVVQQDYVRTARAKGLTERVVIWKHAFRNSLIPFLTLLGLIIPTVLGGSVILEVIFTWPGLGRLFYDSLLQRDIFTVMALSTATAVLVLGVTLIVDLLYGVVDPRVSHR